jgi:hypothetical protein
MKRSKYGAFLQLPDGTSTGGPFRNSTEKLSDNILAETGPALSAIVPAERSKVLVLPGGISIEMPFCDATKGCGAEAPPACLSVVQNPDHLYSGLQHQDSRWDY